MSELHNHHNLFASKTAFLVALLLVLVKGVVGFLTGSLAVVASAIDSFFDMIVSIVNYFTIKAAAEPPDEEHTYGHGKFEAFSEFFQSLLIGGSGIFLAIESIKRILTPAPISQGNWALGVMVFSFLITFFLVKFLKKSAKKTGSLVLKADSEHYRIDLLSNGAIIGGLILTYFFDWDFIDGVLSLGVSVLIMKTALELFHESFEILTDREICELDRKKIIKILEHCKEFDGWHQLRTRRVGSEIHMDVHLEFSEDLQLLEAHDRALLLEERLQEAFPNIVLLTHFDTHNDQAEDGRFNT